MPLSGDDTKADYVGYRSYIDRSKADALFAAIRADRNRVRRHRQRARRPPLRPPPVTVPPSAVAVTVENGSGITGQASRAAADLRAVGFHVTVSTGGPHGDTTTIRYGSGRRESAQTLTAAVPGATLQASGALGPQALVLLTGRDYTSAQGRRHRRSRTEPDSTLPSARCPDRGGVDPGVHGRQQRLRTVTPAAVVGGPVPALMAGRVDMTRSQGP